MDRILNPRIEKQSIYEIYRACRLCGAGAGYKMPIIQNVVDLDDQDVQLKQKIRECVQIEVHQDDKMPPLICELCVDKVNDFYEFLDMCRQTNIRTRLRLGLPPQSLPRGAPDAGDCILGLTEPVYINSDEDEPLMKQKRPQPAQKNKVKKEPVLRIKIEKFPAKLESRTTRHKTSRREPTPPRVTRHSKTSKDSEEVIFSTLGKDTTKLSKSTKVGPKSSKVGPKSILKREERRKSDDTSLLTPRLKRPREKDNKPEIPNKKVKIAVQSAPPPRRAPPPPAPPPPAAAPRHTCAICHITARTAQGLVSHVKTHTVGFTSTRLSCNACGVWFVSGEEAQSHHRQHKTRNKPYTCRRCDADFKHQAAYDEHFDKNQCIPYDIVPDVRCERCWHEFATRPLLDAHKCPGEDGRPGGKCVKCKRSYALRKNLRRHEQTCTARRKGSLIVDPELLGRLKPMQVRVARCDPLLADIKREQHVDVSTVSYNFGLDRSCTYPYISSVSSLRIKTEPEDMIDSMVSIKQEIKEEFCTEENFVHWDSTSGSDSETEVSSVVLNPFAKRKKIDSLSTLSLKTIFSQKFLGKVPKKRKRVKMEHGFDSGLANDVDDSLRKDIDNIIDNLGNDDANDSGVGNHWSEHVDNYTTDCSNDSFDLLKGVSIDACKNEVNNDSVNDDSNDLLKDDNVKNDDEPIVGLSKESEISLDKGVPINESLELIQSLSDDLSEKDVITETAYGSNDKDDDDNDKNDALNEKLDECNDKTIDICNNSSTVTVNNLHVENGSRNISTGNDNVEHAADTENMNDSNSFKEYNRSTELIENSVKNGSLHYISNEKDNNVTNDRVQDVQNDSSSHLNFNSNEHNNIEQTSLSNDKISLDSDHINDKSDVTHDKSEVINECIVSPAHNEDRCSYLHDTNGVNHFELENDTANVTDDINENSVSQVDCKTNNTVTCNNSNTDTAVLELKNNYNTSAVSNDNSSNETNNSSRSNETKSEEDDRRLMEELDAQIAENSGSNDRCGVSNDRCGVSNDNTTLEDLVAGKEDENSLGLDSISDGDFNFDN